MDQIEKIKIRLEESKYSKVEIKCILSILSDEKQKLKMSIKEIDNNDFIGCTKKAKKP